MFEYWDGGGLKVIVGEGAVFEYWDGGGLEVYCWDGGGGGGGALCQR